MSTSEQVQYLDRPEGRIAYTSSGRGPLVVAAPGMGDLRSVYDGLVADLVESGNRVVVTDLAGHGDSDGTFRTFGDEATAADLIALVERLGESAVLVGNSMAGSAALLVAARRPDLVRGLVLISPFARGTAASATLAHLLVRVLFGGPWGVRAWVAYYRSTLNRGTAPVGLTAHAERIRASMRRPGRLRQFGRLAAALDHRVVEPELPRVVAPTLVVIGDRDPDYRDPAEELAWTGRAIVGARTLLVPDAAHYAHVQRPDVVLPAVREFVAGLPAVAARA